MISALIFISSYIQTSEYKVNVSARNNLEGGGSGARGLRGPLVCC